MCFQRNIYLLLGRLEARQCGAPRDATDWRATLVEKGTPMEKEAGVVENAAAGRWPD
jgi:hypothetical protein